MINTLPGLQKEMKWVLRIAIGMAALFIFYYVIMTAVIPVNRFRISVDQQKPARNKVFLPYIPWQYTVSDSIRQRAVNLVSRESFLLSRMELTESDSISLTISLRDSTACLVVQGVTIFTSKIEYFEVSPVLLKSDPFVLSHWLSTPFVVDTHYSSIPKVPVLYKKAPKDTLEALSQLEPDPLKDDLDPVYFRLLLTRGLTLTVEQSEVPENGDLTLLKNYRKKLKRLDRQNIAGNLFRFRPVNFTPGIKIVLDKKSARVIYRAIPVDALVAVQLN